MSATAESLTCSAKGCQEDASWALLWNNPRLHTPDRRKTWTACDEHRESLTEFLASRGFLRETHSIAGWNASVPAPPAVDRLSGREG